MATIWLSSGALTGARVIDREVAPVFGSSRAGVMASFLASARASCRACVVARFGASGVALTEARVFAGRGGHMVTRATWQRQRQTKLPGSETKSDQTARVWNKGRPDCQGLEQSLT